MCQKRLLCIVLLTLPVLLFSQEHGYSNYSSESGLEILNGGNGVVVGDFNGDGYEDVFVPGQGQPSLLLKNMGDSTFQNVINSSGVQSSTFAFTAAWVDIDNDDDLDLFIGNYANAVFFSSNLLYLNDGSGQFTDITFNAGVGTYDGTRSIAVADVDSDGFSDIYVCNLNSENILWRNNGDLTFTDITSSSGASDTQISMGAIFFDYDNDGDQDLYLTHDSNQANILYENNGWGEFADVSVQSGLGLAAMGMGVDCADINNDGWMDVYVTNLGPNFLFLSNQDGTFSEVGESVNADDGGMGWGCFFIDHDNDTDQDLYVVNQYGFAPFPNRLYSNDGEGIFEDVASESILESTNNGFGGAWLDMDNNGYQDILVANIGNASAELFLNDTKENHWLTFDLKGTVSARDAFGTKVKVFLDDRILIAEKKSGSSYSSQSSHRVHFGLGQYEAVDSVQIIFPSGIHQVLSDLPLDAMITVIEDSTGYEGDCAPEALFEWTALGQGEVMFTGMGEEEITEWSYTMSDGEILSDQSGIYVFPNAGDFEVCLTVANDCGSNISCQLVEVICESPEAEFEVMAEGLMLSASSLSVDADSLHWSFGDGQESTSYSPDIMYEVEGQYEVCLTAFNSCGSANVCESISIICPIPNPEFTYTIDNLQVDYSDLTLLSDSILFDFGDGSLSQSDQGSHTYLAEGNYQFCMTAFSACGEQTECDTITVNDIVNGITDYLIGEQVKLFPNPTSGLLYMEGPGLNIQSVHVETMDGKKTPLSYRNTGRDVEFDGIEQLTAGSYLLCIVFDSGTVAKRLTVLR